MIILFKLGFWFVFGSKAYVGLLYAQMIQFTLNSVKRKLNKKLLEECS